MTSSSTEEQILALERFDLEYPGRHIEVKKNGERVAVNTSLDAYLETYHRTRPHRGRGMDGRTAVPGLQKANPKAQEPEEVSHKEAEDRSLKR